MTKKQKLELTWIGKDVRPRLEPRILLEDPALSFHAETRLSENDTFDNMLIHGDNLLALKALEQQYAGRVKCIYIDPPYNTGSAFEHYDDGVEHSLWLSLMRDRIEVLYRLLDKNYGTLWISIDDTEVHYLKIILDEIFGRNCFIASNVWQKRYSRENREAIGDVHEYILVYAKDPQRFKENRNKLGFTEKQAAVYKNPNNDPRGAWRTIPLTAQAGHATPSQFYELTGPTGKKFSPPPGRCWSVTKEVFNKLLQEGRIYFGKNGESQPATIRYMSEVAGVVPWTWWPHNEVGHTDEAKKEILSLFREDVFVTPKPERLIQRILHIATNPGDLVLDSFLGSGTTAAVAHKMGRRWIGIELGEHCYTHCIPRLQNVIKNEDPGGVTKATNWQGGGGFRFYRLGPSLIRADAWGNPVINPEFNPEMLAEALCKLENFTYAPSPEIFWIHGQSSERDFIYVTTQFLTQDMLAHIAAELTPERSLLICCGAYSANPDAFPNITLKKIPKAVLDKCEWGHDDYSLAVENLPRAEAQPIRPEQYQTSRKSAKSIAGQVSLFDKPGD